MKTATTFILCALFAFGCSSNPVRWQPTEPQKQAADLTVKDLVALAPHVSNEGQPYRRKALSAAEVTQTYIGLPAERPTPLSPLNQGVIGTAAQTAGERPTFAEAANATIDTAATAADAGLTLVDNLLVVAGSVLGTWGVGKAASKVVKLREAVKSGQDRAKTVTTALHETVTAIDDAKAALDPEAMGVLKELLAKAQSKTTKLEVAETRN